MMYVLLGFLIIFLWLLYILLTYKDIDHQDIRKYYDITDPSYPEREIYNVFKHNTSWKLLVLKVRVIELVYTLFPMLYAFGKYPDNLIDMVNRWEK